jgi:hypothetical protein
MTITFNDTNDHQTTPTDTQAHTEHPETTAARILLNLSSAPSSTPSQGTPPLGDQLRQITLPVLPVSLFATGLSVPEICSDRTGLSEFANNYLDSDVEDRIQVVLKAVKYVLSSTPRLQLRTRSASAQHLKLARKALLLTTNNPPRHPQQRSYRDVLESRPKPSQPPPRQLVPLGRPRPPLAPSTGPPPIPWHSRPTRPASLDVNPLITAALASLPRKQLIDLLREVLGRPPLANVAPQFGTFRASRRRAFRAFTLKSAPQKRAYPGKLTPINFHRRRQPLDSQSDVFSQTHPRKQRVSQQARQ